MGKGLSRKELQIIAIISMVIDHFAWGFLNFYSVEGQILHVMGRLTIPIMCFFVAEGYRKTTNLRNYIKRMAMFAIITIIPFYLFFHEEYDYRQNIIFDYLLALLVLTVANHQKLVKWQKTVLITSLVIISAVIGGWPIMPIVYVCIFYYGKDFKTKCKWFCSATVGLVAFMCVVIYLNQMYHFSHYDWIWYEKAYFLGFMLALPLLSLYNGKKGDLPLPRYFFYLFYPGHFLVLYTFKMVLGISGIYGVYLLIHIITIVIALAMLCSILQSRPSKAQVSLVFLMSFSIMYLIGFLIEITTKDMHVLVAAVQVEYLGECLAFIGITWFLAAFLHIRVPKFVYAIETIIALLMAYMIFTIEYNTLFYKSMALNTDGPFSRLELEYGIGFYLLMGFLATLCIIMFVIGVKNYRQSVGLEKKRILWILVGICCPWLATGVRVLNLTGGYEVTSIGIIGISFCFEMGLIRYGFFDSTQAAYTNAFNRRREAMMIINLQHHILYLNDFMQELFPDVTEGMDAYHNATLKKIIEREQKYYEYGKNVYEIRMDDMIEAGYVQGKIIWSVDATEHINSMRRIESLAQNDPLTGLYNRKHYEDGIEEVLKHGMEGSMVMIDVDDFKHINDTYGHGIGDQVLIAVATAIKNVSNYKIRASRIGGDEFNFFVSEVTDDVNLGRVADCVINNLKSIIKEKNLPQEVTLSIGIMATSAIESIENIDFATLYANADKALYLAKNKGKNQYQIFK